MTRFSAVFALAAALGLGSAAAQAAGVEGVWLTEKGKVAVELYPCGERMCGKIVWLEKPRWSEGTLKRDERNPDPALRERPWCGIEVISGLRPDGRDWEDGSFYYPKEGKTFDLEMRQNGDDTLKVRAYLGVKLLGKTEIWTRANGELPGCEPDDGSGL
ncbi:DUF2147 domain-containing protein [Limibaculum sp. M0105]|uniref:DUF2147 domain-containing protein n=1 Tax=Thermohalobaculum xanthum TaxID=2753746 RepID=A0A8J7M822_9RHOB|nr:DUF2147 domain-containing protein [Thermohalobaculum xanthum]MBK0400294.1 DUF2147 domain-containing protein [Thermohalobaculum xanthum]